MAACGAAQKAAIKVMNQKVVVKVVNTGGSDAALVWAVQAAHEVAKSAQTIPSRSQLMSWMPGGIVNRVLCYSKALQLPLLEERRQLAVILRDVIGNPFRSVSVLPSWLAWNDGAIRKMAQAIYDGRAFDRLPLLADALEEAGCADADILSHCREPGEHVRGCWVVDLLLGKA